MLTFTISTRNRSRTVDTWQEVYETLCDLHGIDPIRINPETHAEFADAEAWCELLCGTDGIYENKKFTITVNEDFENELDY